MTILWYSIPRKCKKINTQESEHEKQQHNTLELLSTTPGCGSAKSVNSHCSETDVKEPRIRPRVKNSQGQR